MIRFVHIENRFEKQLRSISRAGKKGALAAAKAREMMDNLVQGRAGDFSELGSMTKYGEARIDKCVKYDLGAGYRAVCAWSGDAFFMLFMGAHDECDKWLEANRGINVQAAPALGRRVLAVKTEETEEGKKDQADALQQEDPFLLKSIDQQTLRKVFCGLCRNQ